jgi:tripartite-type tricarboxylate transporter receptor subunit TctC
MAAMTPAAIRQPHVRLGWFLAALMLVTGIAGAAAETFPARPIRLVVGFTPGGPADVPARFIAGRLQAKLGQPVLVENKPGAGGMIALNDVLAQPRDGYSLQLCTYFDALNTILYKNVSYKLSDVAPVTLISKYYYLITLANSVPADNFDDFVRYAKAHPGELLYGEVGAGSAQELVAHELEKTAGIKMVGVPFKGSAQITQEMLAGRIHFQVAPPIAVGSFYKSGQLKVVALTSPERLESLPEIPTLIERGVDVSTYGWLGVCAGAGTPKSVIDILNRNIVSIVQSDEYRAFMDKVGNIAIATTPEEFGRVLVETVDHAAPYIREFHMQIE